MTSSPGPISRQAKARWRADVPLAVATPDSTPQSLQRRFQTRQRISPGRRPTSSDAFVEKLAFLTSQPGFRNRNQFEIRHRSPKRGLPSFDGESSRIQGAYCLELVKAPLVLIDNNFMARPNAYVPLKMT